MATNYGDCIIEVIIQGGLVRADEECPNVLIWSANAPEQLEAWVHATIADRQSQITSLCQDNRRLESDARNLSMMIRRMAAHPDNAVLRSKAADLVERLGHGGSPLRES